MGEHMLDRPVWSALNTVHARFATGSGCARRFAGDISPFGAACSESAGSLAELGSLIASGGRMVIAQAAAIALPPGTRAVSTGVASQMHFDGSPAQQPQGLPIRKLGARDSQAMVELAALTKPGPFANRTYLLGDYWGIEHDGRLVAMAGERFKQPGFTEISGVCTHPDHQGRGYAQELFLVVLNRIISRGEQPYLHVYLDNRAAIALYHKLGFRERRQIHVGLLEPA